MRSTRAGRAVLNTRNDLPKNVEGNAPITGSIYSLPDKPDSDTYEAKWGTGKARAPVLEATGRQNDSPVVELSSKKSHIG